jgi:hypothetical protein
MQKKEMQKKCDYDLIAIYQNGDDQEKKDALEVMYMRYQPLIRKIAGKYCQYTGVSNFEDFQQEAFFELVRVFDQADLDRITPSWKIVWVYKYRLKNLMGLMKRHEDLQTSHLNYYCKGNKNQREVKKVKVKSSPYVPSSDEDNKYEYQIDYIQQCYEDDRISKEEKEYNHNLVMKFISKLDKPWLREALVLLMSGNVKKGEACEAVEVANPRFHQVVHGTRQVHLLDENGNKIKNEKGRPQSKVIYDYKRSLKYEYHKFLERDKDVIY